MVSAVRTHPCRQPSYTKQRQVLTEEDVSYNQASRHISWYTTKIRSRRGLGFSLLRHEFAILRCILQPAVTSIRTKSKLGALLHNHDFSQPCSHQRPQLKKILCPRLPTDANIYIYNPYHVPGHA